MAVDLLRYLFGAIVLIFFQFFLIQEIHFGPWIKPMPYILFIFLLPFTYNRFLILLTSFFAGFFLDALCNSGGLHAAACSTLAFSRILADTKFLDADAIQLQGFRHVTPEYKNFRFYALYTLLLIFIHHWVYFTLDYFSIASFFNVLIVALFSSIGTFLLMLLFKVIASVR
jgi:hypothetical protein